MYIKNTLKNSCLLTGLISVLLVSCIKDAPLNPEADIEAFTLDAHLTTGATVIDQANRKIQLYITSGAFDAGFAPAITVSRGAKITPASGDSIHPGEHPVVYTVTSENGANEKKYMVEVINVGNWSFDFETWRLQDGDQYEYPVEPDGVEIWSSGNLGVSLAGVPKRPDAYPTRSTADAWSGHKAVELVTIKGTVLSEFVGAYIFAGSVFLGTFNASVALANPLKATEFGQPYTGLPKRFTGYYKYAPGAAFQDEHKNIVPGKTDACSIYAVLFRGPARLDATNIQSSDRVIATAVLADGSARAAYTKFDIPFTYKAGWDGSSENLMITIVASSSSEGDHYRGAIGSKLVLDSLAVIPK